MGMIHGYESWVWVRKFPGKVFHDPTLGRFQNYFVENKSKNDLFLFFMELVRQSNNPWILGPRTVGPTKIDLIWPFGWNKSHVFFNLFTCFNLHVPES